MGTVYYLDNTYKVPNGSAPLTAEAYTVWIQNPRGLETWIYDDGKVPAAVFPHDHQEKRGKPLWNAFWSTTFGPHGVEGGGINSWIQGIPLYPPSSPNDFTERPKCLGWWPFRIPGQVKAFFLEFLVYLDGATTRTVSLKARIRPYSEVGLDHDQGIGPSASITTSQTTGLARVTRDQFSFTDVTALGDPGLDKEDLVLELWITSNPSAGRLFRLLAAAAVSSSSYAKGQAEPVENTPARAQVSLAEIKEAEFLYSDTAQRAHLRYNQINLQALGLSPGLRSNLDTELEDDPYQTIVYEPHKHRGRRYLDPVTGAPVYDGAVARRLLWHCAPIVDLGDTVADMNSEPGQGHKLHSGGSSATQAEIRGRLSLPLGLKAIQVRFSIKPGTSAVECRLYFYVQLYDITGTNIEIGVNSQGIGPASAKSGAFTVVDVLPLDNQLWQSNAIRTGIGLGLWTEDAAKTPAPYGAQEAGRVPRVSRAVTIGFNLTKVDYPYILRCKWALETGVRGSGVFATGARLAWVAAFVPPGY
jgi:hypothetical protein